MNTYYISKSDYKSIGNTIIEYVANHINTKHISFSLSGVLENDYKWEFEYVGSIKEEGSIIDVLFPIYWNLIIHNDKGEIVPNDCEYLHNIFDMEIPIDDVTN